jgi:phytoene dehydrogenase-like protein
MNDHNLKIAVVGDGIAGIVSAYLLQQKHQVTLLEQNDYPGGHTNTIEIKNGPDTGLAVDTGFIVLNDATYPLFQKFLSRLGVQTRDTDMSFGFQCLQTGLVFAGNNLNGLFAQRRNLLSPNFYKFLLEIGRFSQQARNDLEAGTIPPITFGEMHLYLLDTNASDSSQGQLRVSTAKQFHVTLFQTGRPLRVFPDRAAASARQQDSPSSQRRAGADRPASRAGRAADRSQPVAYPDQTPGDRQFDHAADPVAGGQAILAKEATSEYQAYT